MVSEQPDNTPEHKKWDPIYIEELNKYAGQICNILETKNLHHFFTKMSKKWKIDLDTIHIEKLAYRFYSMAEEATFDLEHSDKMLERREEGGLFDNPRNFLPAPLATGFFEIFSCVLLHKKYNIKKAELIGMINLSENFWSSHEERLIQSIVIPWICENRNQEKSDAKELINWIKEMNKKPPITNGEKEKPKCPMIVTDNNTPWIHASWDYIEKYIEPLFE